MICISVCAGMHAQTVVLQEFATGLSNLVEITHAGDNRLFAVQQSGQIKIIQPSGAINPTNFLDLSGLVTFGGERGLLGLAFHPQFASNGYFFVYYNNGVGDITVERYTVNGVNPDVADSGSAKQILSIPKPFSNHNGGSMHFDSNGYLWISTGDGGGGGDPNNLAQNKNSLLGKMLRIDVNATGPYNIPAGNPFTTPEGAPEIWSYGLRNAWKFSFDQPSGNVMIADVGQNQIEEINRMPVTQAGINYGWRCYEGNSSYNTTGCAAQSTMTFPVTSYNHSGGRCSITGGYVYRGTQYPAFTGKYFFADYCSNQIGLMHADDSITWTPAFAGNNFSTFGVDSANELYVAAVNNGKIYRLTTTSLSTDETEAITLELYPNPASDMVYVRGLKPGKYHAELITADGRKAGVFSLNEQHGFDIKGLSAGLYFVTISSEHMKVYSQKLMVK